VHTQLDNKKCIFLFNKTLSWQAEICIRSKTQSPVLRATLHLTYTSFEISHYLFLVLSMQLKAFLLCLHLWRRPHHGRPSYCVCSRRASRELPDKDSDTNSGWGKCLATPWSTYLLSSLRWDACVCARACVVHEDSREYLITWVSPTQNIARRKGMMHGG